MTQKQFRSPCTFCAHFQPRAPGRHCAAYPAGGKEIPWETFSGKESHYVPNDDEALGEDGGRIYFEIAPGASLRALRRLDVVLAIIGEAQREKQQGMGVATRGA